MRRKEQPIDPRPVPMKPLVGEVADWGTFARIIERRILPSIDTHRDNRTLGTTYHVTDHPLSQLDGLRAVGAELVPLHSGGWNYLFTSL